jgi:glycosyltransferase involved in cell wall biosynthesis
MNVDLLFSPLALTTPPNDYLRLAVDAPIVSILIDLQHIAYPQFFSTEEVQLRSHNLSRYRASYAIAISHFVREQLLQEGFSPKSLETIHIRLAQRTSIPDHIRAEQTLRKLDLEAKSYFYYPANFWRHKNHEMLIAAFALAKSWGLARTIKLVCTGSPNIRLKEIQCAVQAFGLAGHVIFPSFVDDVEYSILLRSSLGLVFPSLYEGFGMAVLEAMAVGCPVACSNATSLPEVTGGAAFLFDARKPQNIAEALWRLATDEAIRAELIEKGRQRADLFSDPDEMARKYWHVFERVRAAPNVRT